jgi:uncharacterized protein (UPF0332 family)
MKAEAANYFFKAQEDLSDARQIAAIGLAKVAARSAYYAAFHAAEARIVERTGKVAKSHSGVRSEFARLARDDPHLGKATTAFFAQAYKYFAQAYKYKEIGDYGVGADAVITLLDAAAAIKSAQDFLTHVAAALA